MARTDYYGIQTPVLQATSQAIRTVNGTVGTIAPEDWGNLIRAMHSQSDYDNVMAQLVEETTTPAAIASFTDGANNLPVKNLEVNVTAWQEGSGDPAPDNVRPVHGFDKVRVNMVDFNQITNNGNFSSLDYWSAFNGTISVNSNECVYTFTSVANDRYSNSLRYSMYLIPTHKYFFSSDCYVTKPSKTLIYDIGNAYIKDKAITAGWNRVQTIMDATFSTAGKKSCYIGLEFCGDFNYQVGDTYKMKNIMAFDLTQMFGSRIADYLYNLESNQEGAGVALFRQLFYKDYYDYNVGGTWVSVASVNGDSYPDYAEIALGNEIFGGKVNFTTGEMEVDWELVAYKGTELWQSNGANGYYLTLPIKFQTYQKPIANYMKGLPSGVGTELQNWQLRLNGQSVNLLVKPDMSQIATVADWKTYLTQHNLIVVLNLATPFTVQLTPQQISTLLGNNTFFADTGNISITYRANGALYVAQH